MAKEPDDVLELVRGEHVRTTVAPIVEWDLNSVEVAPEGAREWVNGKPVDVSGKKYLTRSVGTGRTRIEVTLQLGDPNLAPQSPHKVIASDSTTLPYADTTPATVQAIKGMYLKALKPALAARHKAARHGSVGGKKTGEKRRVDAAARQIDFLKRYDALMARRPLLPKKDAFRELRTPKRTAERWLATRPESPEPDASVKLYRAEKERKRGR